jgi:hypothetical protein
MSTDYSHTMGNDNTGIQNFSEYGKKMVEKIGIQSYKARTENCIVLDAV